MRTLSTRLREAEQIDHPNEADYSRLLILASDMEDEIDRLRDLLAEEIAHREQARSEAKFWLSYGNGDVT
jgi:hypothetical protein